MEEFFPATITADFIRRAAALRPDTPRRWGTMTVDQMLWHVNGALEMALGRIRPVPKEPGRSRGLFKWIVLRVPWPKGKTPTADELKPSGPHDFEGERARLKELLETIASRSTDGEWPTHSTFGPMSGKEWRRLQRRHIDHHFKQFGV